MRRAFAVVSIALLLLLTAPIVRAAEATAYPIEQLQLKLSADSRNGYHVQVLRSTTTAERREAREKQEDEEDEKEKRSPRLDFEIDALMFIMLSSFILLTPWHLESEAKKRERQIAEEKLKRRREGTLGDRIRESINTAIASGEIEAMWAEAVAEAEAYERRKKSQSRGTKPLTKETPAPPESDDYDESEDYGETADHEMPDGYASSFDAVKPTGYIAPDAFAQADKADRTDEDDHDYDDDEDYDDDDYWEI